MSENLRGILLLTHTVYWFGVFTTKLINVQRNTAVLLLVNWLQLVDYYFYSIFLYTLIMLLFHGEKKLCTNY